MDSLGSQSAAMITISSLLFINYLRTSLVPFLICLRGSSCWMSSHILRVSLASHRGEVGTVSALLTAYYVFSILIWYSIYRDFWFNKQIQQVLQIRANLCQLRGINFRYRICTRDNIYRPNNLKNAAGISSNRGRQQTKEDARFWVCVQALWYDWGTHWLN